MKGRFLILFFSCLFLLHFKAQSHQDSWHAAIVDNVMVRVKTGREWEEIKKCFIIAELAAQLSRELNYVGPILLSFDHKYIAFKEQEDDYYSINIGNGKLNKANGRRFDKYYALKKRGIVINQIADFFEAGKTLQLLADAIENIELLKKAAPKSRKVAKPIISSIDSLSYLNPVNMLQVQPSDQVKTVLQTKIYTDNGTLKYYYKEDSFHFVKIEGRDTTDLLCLKNVVLVQKNIVFDTDTSFYYVDQQVSTRHTINLGRNDDKEELRRGINELKMRVRVEEIDAALIGFSYPIHRIFMHNQRRVSTYVDCYSIYFPEKDYFAQDIRHLLLEKTNQNKL